MRPTHPRTFCEKNNQTSNTISSIEEPVEYEAVKKFALSRDSNIATIHVDTSSSIPTVCSSSFESLTNSENSWKCALSPGVLFDSDLEKKSFVSTSSGDNNVGHNPKFSYKEILMLSNDYASLESSHSRCSATSSEAMHRNNNDICENFVHPTTQATVIESNIDGESDSAVDNLRQVGKKKPKKTSEKNGRQYNNSTDNFNYTKKHTNGEMFTRLGGSRVNTTVLREAVSQAVSQGVLTKSNKREFRQFFLRGQKQSILDELRKKCHVKPIVSPVETRAPNEYELRGLHCLMKYVNTWCPELCSDEMAKRHIVLMEIERIVDFWVETEASRRFIHEGPSSLLLVGGSSHLKIEDITSDIDVVVVVPVWLTLEECCENLHAVLVKKSEVSTLIKIIEGPISGLSFEFNGVNIDLMFARFTQKTVQKDLPVHSDHILSGMDAMSVRAISAPRVSTLVLDLIPNPDAFRQCLRAVRYWARRRGLYNPKVGFLGGISWTISVALVCQMFPNAVASSLLHHYFSVMSTWEWPTPLMLSHVYEAGLGFKQWCPKKNVQDQAHVMPIITPGYPSLNSSRNVTRSTLKILTREFQRGKLILDEMFLNNLSSSRNYARLFDVTEFSYGYGFYLRIDVTSESLDELPRWCTFVEGRIRKLVETLETIPAICNIHPSSDSINLESEGVVGKSYFVGLDLLNESSDVKQRNYLVKTIIDPVIEYFRSTQLYQGDAMGKEMVVSIKYQKWEELPDCLLPMKRFRAAGLRAKYMLSRAHTNNMYYWQQQYSPSTNVASTYAPPMYY